MALHRNARLGLAGRRALVADIESGLSCRAAARRRGVSPTTACKWWRRWSSAPLERRRSLACLEDRSSRPQRMPRLLSADEQERICAARRRSSWGPRLIAGEVGHPHATVWRTLKRAGIEGCHASHAHGRVSTSGLVPAICCISTRSASSASAAQATLSPATGTSRPPRNVNGSATEWVHSLVDDHSRLAYSELHYDERAATVTGFVERGLAFYSAHGIEAKRLLSDNAFVYRRNRSLRELLAEHSIEHRFIRPRRPQNKREGRTLPTNPQARMGTRSDLPLQRPPRPGPRRPATHQPRPQRPEAGQLGA